MMTMPRHFNRGLGLRPINSVKNIVDGVFLGVTAGVVTGTIVADTINDYTGGNPKDVPIGAKVSSIFFSIDIQPQAVSANVDFYIAKFPAGLAALPVPGATGGDISRKYILHEEKGIPGAANNGSPPKKFLGVIRIPKGKQRMGEGESIRVQASCATAYDLCIKAIYKFYQ